MAKKRIDKRGTREPIVKVAFLVEGSTEEFYFKEFLKSEGYSLHLDIENIMVEDILLLQEKLVKINLYMI